MNKIASEAEAQKLLAAAPTPEDTAVMGRVLLEMRRRQKTPNDTLYQACLKELFRVRPALKTMRYEKNKRFAIPEEDIREAQKIVVGVQRRKCISLVEALRTLP